VLRGHCADLGRDYDEISKTVITKLDLGERSEQVDAVLEQLREWADLGITHVHTSLADSSNDAVLEQFGDKIIPAIAKF